MLTLLVPTLACRKFMIAGAAGSWSSLVMVERDPMTRGEPARVGHQRNSVLHVLADGHRRGAAAGQYRCAGAARGLVDLAQTRPAASPR